MKQLFLALALGALWPFGAATATTCPLSIGGAYKTANRPGVYYISEECAKRPILNPSVYFSHFDSWDHVIVTTNANLDAIPDHPLSFLPWGPKRVVQDGSLIKTVTDPNVYVKISGNLHAIGSEAAFQALGYQWAWVEDVFPSVIEQYPIRDAIHDPSDYQEYPQGFVFAYPNDPKVYILKPSIEGDLLPQHIVTYEELTGLYRADRVATIPETVIFVDRFGPDRSPETSQEEDETDMDNETDPEPSEEFSLTDYLLAYWSFDNSLLDSSGNAFHGSIFGAVDCSRAGKAGRGCNIPKGGNQIIIADAPLLNADISRGITVTGWLYFEGTHRATFPWTIGDRNFFLDYVGDGVFECGMRGSATDTLIKTRKQVLPTTLQWLMHSCIYDPITQELRLYVGDELMDTADASAFSEFSSLPSEGMGIGCSGPGRCDAEILMETMSVDELRIYNRALSEDELRSLQIM